MTPSVWPTSLHQLPPRTLSDGPAAELDLSRELLDLARSLGPDACALSLYRPEPTLAFGRRDTHLAGYGQATALAVEHGFTPVVRLAGGRAAAYNRGSLVMELAGASPDVHAGIRERFIQHAELVRDILSGLGVDARIGEVPGEYCPGEFSINARGTAKLVGAAQRIAGGAWLLSAVIQVEDGDRLLAVTDGVYRALELPWRPESFGTIGSEVPGMTVADVETAIRRACAELFETA